jgi:beta-glucosidase
LPLSKKLKSIVVIGDKAFHSGSQCGGWTVSWQGEKGDVPGATSILEAVQATVPQCDVRYSKDASDLSGADAIILVAGEKPYAEYEGDSQDLALSAEDADLFDKAQASGLPAVAVLLSGRPIIITDEISKVGAFVAAWLPGSEAAGISDVLFGDYKPSGKLSFTWPSSVDQLPINKGDGKKGLFPFGYGLTYN